MIDKHLKKIVESAQGELKLKDAKEIRNLPIYIGIISKYCQEIQRITGKLKAEEIENIIRNEVSEMCEDYCKKGMIRGSLLQIEAVRKLKGDREKIIKIYDKIKDRKFNDATHYNINLESSYEKVMIEANEGIRLLMKEVENKDEVLNVFTQYVNADRNKKILMKKKYSELDLGKVEHILPVIVEKNPITKFQRELELLEKLYKEDLKQKQIDLMVGMGEFFKKFGYFDRYININNANSKKITEADLSYSIKGKDDKSDMVGVQDLFTREFLEKKDLEEILMYSMFWQNRFGKECAGINKAIFSISDLGLWDDIAKGKTDLDISQDKLEGVFRKQKVVEKISLYLISSLQANTKNIKMTEEEKKLGYLKIDGSDVISRYNEQQGENYKRIFDEILPDAENNLVDDVNSYRILVNQTENIYKMKDAIIIPIILELFESSKTKNWGVIPEKDTDSKVLLIGIDYEGLNMPIRLHVDKEMLANTLKVRNKNTILRLYQGNEDFKNDEESIPANLLMPVSKKNIKSIKSRIRELKEKAMYSKELKFLEHLQFLADQDKFPEHLKMDGKRPSIKYMDILTGEQYSESKNGFIKIEEGKIDGR